MRRVFSAALFVIVLMSYPARAQLGSLCLYTDAAASQCNFTDSPSSLVLLYLVHTEPTGAKGVRYSAPIPQCWFGAVFLGDQFQYPVAIGNSQTGVEVSYANCVSGAIHVETIAVFSQGLAETDCAYPVLPDPLASGIEVVDCSDNIVPGIGGESYINSSLPCLCPTGPSTPVLSVSPGYIDFGDVQTEASVNIANAGTGTLTWNLSESIPWLQATPASGTAPSAVSVSVDRSGLAFGTYTGVINVTSNGGNQDVNVSMEVAPLEAVLHVFSPDSLHISWDENSLPVVFQNLGNTDLLWNFDVPEPWLSVSPPGGSLAPGGLETPFIIVDRTGLAQGTYQQTIHLGSNGGDADIIVTADVVTGVALEVTPARLQLTPVSTSRTFSIRGIGPATLTWSLSASDPWIQIVPPLTGSGDATVTVNVDPDQVPPGDLVTGEVTVSSNGGVGTVQIDFYRIGAPGGILGLYADADGVDCAIMDVDGLMSVYVVLTATSGASAVQFAAPTPPCMNAAWISDQSNFALVLGNSQEGTAVAFSNCLAEPIHVMTLLYLGTGTTGACCEYPVLPDPNAPTGTIEVVDCASTKTYALGASAYVNPDGGCPCGHAVKVETKTWGAVKALYLPEK